MDCEHLQQLLSKMIAGEVIDRSEFDSFKGYDFSSQDLSGLNFSEHDLTGASFFGCKLVKTNFYKAKLVNADFTGADVSDAVFAESDLSGASFGHAIMQNTNCFAAKLNHATLTGAKLENIDLRTANLEDVHLREATILNTDFTGAILCGADMSYSSLKGSIFNDADMRNTVLRHVQDFQSSLWIGVDIRNINFSGAYRTRRFIVDQNYLFEFKNRNGLCHRIYILWWLTSDCGRSLFRWFMVIVAEILVFAMMYSMLDFNFKVGRTWFSYIYFSIVTTTTLGYGDIIPATATAQIVSMVQVLLGYVMLGGFLSILTNKMARRAD